MAVTQGLRRLLAVFVVAALTPLLVAALPGPRIPHWNASWRTRFRWPPSACPESAVLRRFLSR